MDFAPVGRPPAGPKLPIPNIVRPSPSIDSHSPVAPHSSSSYLSPSSEVPTPIMIRGRDDDYHSQAPPPLPPPPRPFDDVPTPHKYPYRSSSSRFGPGSAGSGIGSLGDERPHYTQRGVHRDEGYESYGSTNRSDINFGSFHNSFRPSTDDYCDNFMKSKLNPIRTIDNSSSRRPMLENRLPRLTMGRPILEEDDRFTHTPIHSAVSPRGLGSFQSFSGDYRSPESDHSPRQRSRRTNSGSFRDDVTVSTQDSYDMYDIDELDMDDAQANGIRRLRIDDREGGQYPGIPHKRRASSPPVDEAAVPHGPATQNGLFRHREPRSRGSPTPRLASLPKSSLSSTYSSGGASSFSFGRRSPGAMSPGGMSPITSEASCNSPFQTPISLNPSPRGSLSRPTHQRSDSRQVVSPRKPSDLAKAPVTNGHKIQDFYMCECCPKKPKKFDTVEELRAHEAEKQYGCQYCGNRFKNKNEAERHQNSLHVRRHSWSCKAMTTYSQAFHDSTVRPGEADVCGYCGKEFERTGPRDAVNGLTITETDWNDRIQHLTNDHKFRECNSSKKFYRADHFRQHLKHSHHGSSGKWTNQLENACMIEEEPPAPAVR